MLMRRKSGDVVEIVAGDRVSRDSPNVNAPHHGSDGVLGAATASTTTHRRKPFMEALYKAVELAAPEALDWTHDVVHLDAASRSKLDCFCRLQIGISVHVCVP